jgi:tetratricopeptide (TPR) repeat protein
LQVPAVILGGTAVPEDQLPAGGDLKDGEASGAFGVVPEYLPKDGSFVQKCNSTVDTAASDTIALDVAKIQVQPPSTLDSVAAGTIDNYIKAGSAQVEGTAPDSTLAGPAHGDHWVHNAGHAVALDGDPDPAGAHHRRGIACMERLHYKAAVANFSKAIEADPYLTAPYHNRGIAYFWLKQFVAAEADFSKALALDPGLASAYHNRGIVLIQAGRTSAGVADSFKALALDPALKCACGIVTAAMPLQAEPVRPG